MAADMPLVTKDEAIQAFAEIWAAERIERDSLSVKEAAKRAFVPGDTTLEELEELIARHREEARQAQRQTKAA